MKKEEIHFGDIKRWLFGQAPPEFMIEVAIRTILIYLFLLLIVRLMGKRMAGQMTLSEMAVMLTLGAIVSPVMQLPDRGILFGVLVLICALIFKRGLNLWEFKDEKVEKAAQGELSLLVKDGIINLEELEKSNVTKQQLVFSVYMKLMKLKQDFLFCRLLTRKCFLFNSKWIQILWLVAIAATCNKYLTKMFHAKYVNRRSGAMRTW